MLYDTTALMKCQVKKYSGLNFARKFGLSLLTYHLEFGIVVLPLV